MTKFKKYINQIENQDFKEFTKYLDEDELIKLEYHFDNYAKQLTIHSVVVPKGTLCSEMYCQDEAVSVVNVDKWYRCKNH